jgi:hypothetical protein
VEILRAEITIAGIVQIPIAWIAPRAIVENAMADIAIADIAIGAVLEIAIGATVRIAIAAIAPMWRGNGGNCGDGTHHTGHCGDGDRYRRFLFWTEDAANSKLVTSMKSQPLMRSLYQIFNQPPRPKIS